MTQTKQQQALDKIEAFHALQCPVCGLPLLTGESSLRCGKGHTYDIARKGYVHLHHKTVQSEYDRQLFEARRAVFDAGIYGEVFNALKERMQQLHPKTVLDAGCGEGFYTHSLASAMPDCLFIGIDLSKDAIVAAAGRSASALYCVGDLNRLPFADNTFDVILNILSPASYTSFARVLRKGGRLIKIMPGREYLQEIREKLPGDKNGYDDTKVPDYLREHMNLEAIDRLHYTSPLTKELYAHFLNMTPLTQSLLADERKALESHIPAHITIDLQLAVCTSKIKV